MRHPFSLAFVAVALVLASRPLAAEQAKAPAAAPAPAAARAAVAPAVPTLLPPESFTYDPQGRRDPFVSLIAHGTDSKTSPGARRADGIGGLAVGELSVRGVLKSGAGYVALLQGPDNKTYVARPGDRLADGTIRVINDQGLVIQQEVNDPLSLVKQREVRKSLRALDEGK